MTETKADTSPAITPEATPPSETKEQAVSAPSGGNAVEEPPQEVSEPSTHTSSSVEPPPEEK